MHSKEAKVTRSAICGKWYRAAFIEGSPRSRKRVVDDKGLWQVKDRKMMRSLLAGDVAAEHLGLDPVNDD